MLKEYNCDWCRHNFKQNVEYKEGGVIPGTKPPKFGKKGACSSQVKCSKCGNFIPTWSKIKMSDETFMKVRR